MKVLELFAGTRSISKAFEARGHQTFSIEWDRDFPNIDLYGHNGDPCHVRAPRGAKTGTQGLKGSRERSVIPEALCQHVVDICEKVVGGHNP